MGECPLPNHCEQYPLVGWLTPTLHMLTLEIDKKPRASMGGAAPAPPSQDPSYGISGPCLPFYLRPLSDINSTLIYYW